MIREKGFAYCGLACCICSENGTCEGCRNEGCKDKEWCKNFNCCKEKGIKGCWECSEFPCSSSMLEKVRIRAFARFIKGNGEEKFMDYLEKNEQEGMVYHYKGELTGDYDVPSTEDEIIELIRNGKSI